jgi:hypothetical protein
MALRLSSCWLFFRRRRLMRGWLIEVWEHPGCSRPTGLGGVTGEVQRT